MKAQRVRLPIKLMYTTYKDCKESKPKNQNKTIH